MGGQQRLGYWGYTFEPEDDGTRLTESWEFLPAGIAGFRERFGAQADAQIDNRRAAAKSGIPATLAAIKKAAEGALINAPATPDSPVRERRRHHLLTAAES